MLQVSSNAQLTFHLRHTAKVSGSSTSRILWASSLQKGKPRQAAELYDAVGQRWPDVEFFLELRTVETMDIAMGNPWARAEPDEYRLSPGIRHV